MATGFNISSRIGNPDPKFWSSESGFARNEELQWYQSRNAACKNGVLRIERRKERVRNPNYSAGSSSWKTNRQYAEYTSSSITTSGRKTWQFGRVEVRARLDAQMGSWPAIWTFGDPRRMANQRRSGHHGILSIGDHSPVPREPGLGHRDTLERRMELQDQNAFQRAGVPDGIVLDRGKVGGEGLENRGDPGNTRTIPADAIRGSRRALGDPERVGTPGPGTTRGRRNPHRPGPGTVGGLHRPASHPRGRRGLEAAALKPCRRGEPRPPLRGVATTWTRCTKIGVRQTYGAELGLSGNA